MILANEAFIDNHLDECDERVPEPQKSATFWGRCSNCGRDGIMRIFTVTVESSGKTTMHQWCEESLDCALLGEELSTREQRKKLKQQEVDLPF